MCVKDCLKATDHFIEQYGDSLDLNFAVGQLQINFQIFFAIFSLSNCCAPDFVHGICLQKILVGRN